MKLVVIGGGTGANAIAQAFPRIATNVCHVVPISDNGGSTSEVMRVLGGPAIGDLRSRLVRLMPASGLQTVLAHRLASDRDEAKSEWLTLVDGTHAAWASMPLHLKHMYGAFLIHVHSVLLTRGLDERKPFNFSNASVGNLLLTGARLFFGSLEAAIEFVALTTRIPPSTTLLPCLNTNDTYHVAALLRDGSTIVGQNDISHPSADGTEQEDLPGYPFSHPRLSASQVNFSKEKTEPLPSPISRLFYVNMYGTEIHPRASQRVLEELYEADAIVLSVGSLYTSIMPVLVLDGVQQALSSGPKRFVLVLNGSPDRETEGMTAADYAAAVMSAAGMSLSHVIYPQEQGPPSLPLEITAISALCPSGEYELNSLTRALRRSVNLT